MLLHILLHKNAKGVVIITELKCNSLFDTDKSVAGKYIERFEFPWEAVFGLSEFIRGLISLYKKDGRYILLSENVLVAKNASIASDTLILPPCFIDENAEIRKGAFIRPGVIIGKQCVVGNSCEIKNSVLFDSAKVPHFNYVGDSILGYGAHLGAGVITSNVKCDKSEIRIKYKNMHVPTGMKKLGALIGDFSEIGCGSVLNPGSVVGRNTVVYPLTSLRGFLPEGHICKRDGAYTLKRQYSTSSHPKGRDLI